MGNKAEQKFLRVRVTRRAAFKNSRENSPNSFGVYVIFASTIENRTGSQSDVILISLACFKNTIYLSFPVFLLL